MRETVSIYWNDGELLYCLNLVAMGGDDNVGHTRGVICSYLDLQANSARKAGETGTANILRVLSMAVTAGFTSTEA